jgi:hypothetical protein
VPLSRISHLIDVAAVAAEADRGALDELAAAWGCRRLWRTTRSAYEALLLGRRRPLALRTWARSLPAVRERTVVENHLERWIAPHWALSSAGATRATGAALGRPGRGPAPEAHAGAHLRPQCFLPAVRAQRGARAPRGEGPMTEVRLRDEGLTWREIDGEVVALDARAASYVSTNETGTLLWNELKGGTTRERLAEVLVDRFGIETERALIDVDVFLDELRREDLLAP